MADKKLITVFGASGAQGGSVVRFLLDDPDKAFAVRAVTRNTGSDRAKELAKQGAEVVKADLDDIESVKSAVKGAYGVFGVTNYWETMKPEVEVRQGKALVDAVQAAGVKHYVWSTLDYTRDPVVVHCNSKAEVNDYLLSTNVPRTSLYTAFYFENHLTLPPFKLSKSESSGEAQADWPILISDGPIGGYSVADTGAYVRAAFKDPSTWLGKDLRILADVYTPREFVDIMRKATGREISFVETSRERFDSMRSVMEELWNNMEMFYKNKGAVYGTEVIDLTTRLYPQRKDVRTWVEANKEALVQTFS